MSSEGRQAHLSSHLWCVQVLPRFTQKAFETSHIIISILCIIAHLHQMLSLRSNSKRNLKPRNLAAYNRSLDTMHPDSALSLHVFTEHLHCAPW